MNLDYLRAFVVFSEHLNLTQAATVLHISQPALHAQLGRLADDLGVSLYVRSGRSLQLTREGAQVAAFGRELLAQVASFEATLRGESRPAPITLAAGEGSFLYLLGPAVRAFTARHLAPLRLMTADLSDVIEALRIGTAQVGVAALLEPPADIVARPLTDVPPALLVPSGHPLAAGTGPLPLSALSGARLIVPPRGRPHRDSIAAALLEAGVRWEVSVEAGGWELMRHFVGMGLGLAIVNGFCPPPPGGVRRPILGLPARRYWILRRQHAPSTPAAQALVDLMLAHRDGWMEAPDA